MPGRGHRRIFGRGGATSSRFKRGAGIILYRRRKGQIEWLLLQDRKHGKWGFPKGHLERGESILACARRECREEIGHDEIKLSGEYVIVEYQNYDDRDKQVVYFVASTDRKKVSLSREHKRFLWCETDDVLKRLDRKQLRKAFTGLVKRLVEHGVRGFKRLAS